MRGGSGWNRFAIDLTQARNEAAFAIELLCQPKNGIAMSASKFKKSMDAHHVVGVIGVLDTLTKVVDLSTL
ncbi:hypothetical protein RRH01S_01_05400 [Rhizobium rhizogenes NBRC 13257]|uniref:Uncharacterized protein n=1 Tax=Rhizobium rhizogenes NBRC 13257 TaxID=1220581 RepID=A0AA87Q255_RHIRH|nr:hypothetical protein RRH01S_01_05400 [Rhizobium rhizogenes NBRC 13257]